MNETALSLLPLTLVLLILGVIWWKVRRSEANAPPVPVGAAPIPEYKGLLAFFRRHWNGDYSLARSYWVNNFLVSLFAPLIGFLLLHWLVAGLPARYASAGFLSVTAFGVFAWCWAVAGTWASASKHVSRGGRQGWASAAKVMICLGVLKTFVDFGNMLPVLTEHARVASGAQLGPDTKLEVRADGRSILLSGGINDGSAQQLDRALDQAPTVSTVVLASQGGWLREGRLLADVIRRRGLNTYVEDYCASACTIAFLAGKERAADPRAKIGFHATRHVGTTGDRPTANDTAHIRAIYLDAGLPESFVTKALDTPSATMWHPSTDELLAAHVLTRRSMGGETAALSTQVRSKELLAAEFMKTDAFGALAQRSPQDFDRIVEAAWTKLQAGATDAEMTTAAREQFSAMLPRYLPLASDATLIAYQQLMQQELEVLRTKEPRLCVEMAYPSGKPVNYAVYLPHELVTKERGLIAQVMRDADPSRAVKRNQRAIARVVTQAAQGMTPQQFAVFGNEAMRRTSPAETVCDVAVAFFAGLNAIPASERGMALRVVYANN